MPVNCTRCDGTGFLNAAQIPNDVYDKGVEAVLAWIDEMDAAIAKLGNCCCNATENPPCNFCEKSSGFTHDVAVCDCCGDGKDNWYGIAGEHYNADDPAGPKGPYAGNGGLCQCH